MDSFFQLYSIRRIETIEIHASKNFIFIWEIESVTRSKIEAFRIQKSILIQIVIKIGLNHSFVNINDNLAN